MKPYICMPGMLNPKTYIWMRNIYGQNEFLSSSERSARDIQAQQRIIFMACMCIYLWIPPMKPYMCMHGLLNPKTYIWMRNNSGTTMHDSSSERSSRDLYAHLKIVTIYGMVDPKHIHGTSPLRGLYSCLVFMAVF